MTLTGNVRYRRSLFGKMVVQVEEEYRTKSVWSKNPRGPGVRHTRWRDATWRDFPVPAEKPIGSHAVSS